VDQAFNPQHLDHLADVIWVWAIGFVPRLAAAIAVLVIGSIVARWASQAVLGAVGHHIDATVRPMFGSIVRYAILILVIVVALTQIGVQTASLLAVLGAAGLAIGLALQGTLSNIAAGLMLLWLRPFQLGDYIEVNGMSGTVREIGLFVCHLETFDGIFLFAPNSAIWNNALKNHSLNRGRLVSVDITMSNKADIDRVRSILLSIAGNDDRILKDPPPRVFVESITGAGLMFNLRAWAAPQTFGDLQRTIVERAKRKLEEMNDEAMSPQQVIRAIPPESDPSRLMPDHAEATSESL